MIQFSLSQLSAPLVATHLGADACFSAVSTDTRSLQRGDLFVALQGPNFDGHDYLGQALDRGAVGAMVSEQPAVSLPCLMLKDTRIGLGKLAGIWRRSSTAPVVAITGSNGKTTVKEMLSSILRRCGEVLSTRGNLNNDIGLPLTLLRLQDQDYAVLEMGANHPGEIEYLSRIASPDVALLTNAGRAHLQGFGDLEGVARAKAEIISGLAAGGRFIFNADDAWASLWRELAGRHSLSTFGVRQPADVGSPVGALELQWDAAGFRSRFPVSTPCGEVDIELALPGEHNRMNALAAIAASLALGVGLEQIGEGLKALTPVTGRLQPVAGRAGVGLVDDSYNANPDSVKAAIDVLSSAPGRRFLVLGELAEMGSGTEGFYRDMGAYARAAGIEHLFTLGDAGLCSDLFGPGGTRFSSRQQLITALQQELRTGDRVLIKGSRRAAMEQVVQALSAEGED